MLNETRIKCFLELCNQKNYTRAAERLYISQPALSRHIKLLEQELGVQLIRRNKKQFQLTQEGLSFLKLAKEFSQQEQAFVLASHNLKTNYNAVLRIGYASDFSISKVLLVQELMRSKYPNLMLDFKAYNWQTEILPELLNGRIDVAVAFKSEMGQVPRLNYETIAINYIAVIVSNRHRFWGRSSVQPDELRFENIYIPTQELDPGAFIATVNYLQQYDVFLRSGNYDRCIEEQLLRAARGDCVTLSHMYGSDLIQCAPDQLARIPIAGSDIHYGDVTVVYHDSTPEIDALIDCFHQAFPQILIP